MGFYVFLIVLAIIVCVLLGLIVLVQNSKGGGLASGFQGSNQYMGVRQTADFLEKATWTLAIALLAISLLSFMFVPRNSSATATSSKVKSAAEKNEVPVSVPMNPDNKLPVGNNAQPQK